MKKSLHYENSYRREFRSTLNTQDLKQNLTMKLTRTSLVKKTLHSLIAIMMATSRGKEK